MLLDLGVAGGDGHEVGLGEITVIARFFLLALHVRRLRGFVPAAGRFGRVAQSLAGLLPDRVLPRGLVGHGPFHGPETVHVLDFHDGRGDAARGRVDVQIDVGVHPQAAFLHVAVGDAQVVQQQFQLGEIGLGLGRGAHVGLADDFQKRRARPVQVDAAVGLTGYLVVHALARVFLEVGADDADPLGRELALGVGDLQPAVVAQRQVVLADLVALGQVGIVVILAVPLGGAGDPAVQRQGRLDRKLDRAAVHHRQHARHADAHRAGLRIGRGAEPRAARAEHLARGEQLHVDFQADDDGVRESHGFNFGYHRLARWRFMFDATCDLPPTLSLPDSAATPSPRNRKKKVLFGGLVGSSKRRYPPGKPVALKGSCFCVLVVRNLAETTTCPIVVISMVGHVILSSYVLSCPDAK